MQDSDGLRSRIGVFSPPPQSTDTYKRLSAHTTVPIRFMCISSAWLAASELLRSLVIIPGRAAWTLYVDGLVLNDGGGVLGALSAAAIAALAATRLPKVTVSKRWVSRLDVHTCARMCA